MSKRNYERVYQLLYPLVREFEGFRDKAYWDVTLWSIGFGTTVYPSGVKVKEGDTCTKDEALKFLSHDLSVKRIPFIESKVKHLLSDSELAALASFAYNKGLGGFERSSILEKLNAGAEPELVADEFQHYNKDSKGEVRKGLIRRRKAEAELFLLDSKAIEQLKLKLT